MATNRRFTVLVVDTAEAAVRTSAALSHANFEFVHAGRLANAIDGKHEPPIDAIFLGLSLPDSGPIQALESLRTSYPHVPLILVSDRYDEGIARYALARGAQEFVVDERYDGARLHRIVSHAIERMRADRADGEAGLETASALAASEERFRTMADTVPALIWMTDTEAILRFVNKAWLDFVGWKADGDYTSGWLQGIHPADSRRVLDAFLAAFNTRTGFSMEYRLKRADGQFRWVVDTGVPRLDGRGRFAGFAGSSVDITARKEFEEVVRNAEEDWVSTVDAVSDLILLEDEDGRIRRCNHSACRFSGLRYTEILGTNLIDFFQRGNPAAEHRVSLDNGVFRSARTETRFPGNRNWFEVRNYRLGGAHAGWVHVVKDITERKRNEAALTRLNTAIGQTAELVTIVDARGRIRYVNPAFEATTCFSAPEVIGRHAWRAGIGPVERSEYRRIRSHVVHGNIWNGTYLSRKKDGTQYYEEATISPVKDPAGRVVNFVAVCRDVSDRKRYEAIAEAVNLMENAGYIFSGIRHELGNPINSIKTALSVLRSNVGHYTREVIGDYLDQTLAEIARVEYLLKALKTFSMHEHPKMETTDLGAFLERFCALAEEDFARRGIQVVLDRADKVGNCMVDPRAFHQVLMNIFANAADALGEIESPRIHVRLSRVGRWVQVEVADNGAGMTSSQLADAFKPFYTSKPHGTGLGLVIIKKLVTRMGGTVKITSPPGAGTKLTVMLEGANSEQGHEPKTVTHRR